MRLILIMATLCFNTRIGGRKAGGPFKPSVGLSGELGTSHLNSQSREFDNRRIEVAAANPKSPST
jgi:hypothetical protein